MLLKNLRFGIVFSVKTCFVVSTHISLFIVLMSLISSLMPFLFAILNMHFIDSAIAFSLDNKSFLVVLIWIILISLYLIINYFYAIIYKLLHEKLGVKLREKLNIEVITKTVKLKYQYIEDSKSCDLINRISDVQPHVQATFTNIISIISLVITLCSVCSLFSNRIIWNLFFIIISCLPMIFVAFFEEKERYNILVKKSEISRKSDYLEFGILRNRECADERTLFGFSDYFNDKFEQYFNSCIEFENKARRKWLLLSKLSCSLIIIVCFIILYDSVKDLKSGIITMGFFISITGGIIQLIGILTNQTPSLVTNFVRMHSFFKEFQEFIKLDEYPIILKQSKYNEVQSIEFRNVFFKYPGTDKYVLENVSFTINKGQHMAIVGKNGSGKSTITKLLLKLYDVDEGEILINGQNIRQFRCEDIYRLFSVVHQDYAKYSISARDNIGIGDIENIDNIDDTKRIINAAKLSGISDDIDKLPHGYETYFGKIFPEGVDLSGGQWQKIALSRSLMKKNSVKILDEPTAALDPLQESDLYHRYSKIAQGNTTIFISHRLGSTKLADYILLMDEGRVLGCDTHQKLMESNNLYSEMFTLQKEWYLDE